MSSSFLLHLRVAFLARIKKKRKQIFSNESKRQILRCLFASHSLTFYHTIGRKLYNHACASCAKIHDIRCASLSNEYEQSLEWKTKSFSPSVQNLRSSKLLFRIISITSFSRVIDNCIPLINKLFKYGRRLRAGNNVGEKGIGLTKLQRPCCCTR